MEPYDHKTIEKKWQDAWKKEGVNAVDTKSANDKAYVLVEFPYPSGDLHIGHWFAFAVPDIYARYLRMNGKDVLFPIGFDAFGLPAENAAIKHSVDPKEWTEKNIERMETQLISMGNSFDWDRRISTASPSYYKWTQWIFTELFKKGLAYKKEAMVNWDPVDKTVLANEQVLPDGTAERSGAVVEQKLMNQWFFKITEYADRLVDDLDDLLWPEEIKDSQRNWIGRSHGAHIPFVLREGEKVWETEVFTTRADTLFGVTFISIAPERAQELLKDGWELGDGVASYVSAALNKKARDRESAKEKTGVKTNLVATHPITKSEIPVYVADYVLGTYGTGVVMGVPAHDERDYAFAKNHNLPVLAVIDTKKDEELPYVGEGVLQNSGAFDGVTTHNARKELANAAGGREAVTYRLRDWSVGRQRYWGCPIPIVYDPEGNPHAVPLEHLPWELPTDVDFTPTGEPPLARSAELKERTERIFGKGWTPEVETLDTFMDSSWYYLRYLDPHNEEVLADKEVLTKWLPIDRYSGGSEHTTLHVLYARFIHKALFDLGIVPTSEPFTVRMNRGLILGPDGKRMSKSKGNTVNPDEPVKQYGADTVKSYLAFIGPYAETGNYPWSFDSIAGVRRFLDRVWSLKDRVDDGGEAYELLLNQTVLKVTADIPDAKFHTALAAMMSCLNEFEKGDSLNTQTYKTFITLLAPFAPHMTQEIWSLLGEEGFVHKAPWPRVNEEILKKARKTIAVQVNGKSRGTISVSQDADEEAVRALALDDPNVLKHIGENEVKKVIYVPGKIINILTT